MCISYQCDPLGDQNVFGFLSDPRSPSPSSSSVVMVAARLDTTSFFENVYPGADSPASGIAALLAVAHTLKKVEAKVSYEESWRRITGQTRK